MLVSNLMFDEILMYKKARKMQHSQTEKGVEQENKNHMTCMANTLNTKPNQHYEVKLFYLSYYGIKINVFTICQSYYI
jgi:hypothetical protein